MSRSSSTGASSPWCPEPPSAALLRSFGLEPPWSRVLDVASHDGGTHRWHVLDTATEQPDATIVCVHGNPTWAYAWATFLRRLGTTCRVVAVDQLGMGFSERPGTRVYTDRVRDLGDVVDALGIDPAVPLVVAAHDWGGAIALGWAVDHVDRLAGMVLCNTGIAVPAGRSSPGIIRLAAARPLRDLVCRRTPIFVRGTTRLSGDRLSATDVAAFRAPYPDARSRAAIADFVGDIPLRPGGGHRSDEPIAAVAARVHEIDVPVLLAWGAADPVFDDDFAADLAARLPAVELHRFPTANHLVMAEADVAGVVETWLPSLRSAPPPELSPVPAAAVDGPNAFRALWAAIDERHDDDSTAFAVVGDDDEMSWRELHHRVTSMAVALREEGLRPGDRVAMLTPPGMDLVAAVYAVWRAGGVTVVADRGLGLRGLGAAVRSARPAWVIGPKRALTAARVLRWAPRARGLDVERLGRGTGQGDLPPAPGPDEPAAILFTSGATGPAKGVRYRHGQLAAQRDALARQYRITSEDRLVAAFAPFALYGPALGIPTALPDCDVTRPGELSADALEAACRAVDATMAFASPSALANVVATAATGGAVGRRGLVGLRTVFSAGAPVPAETLEAVAALAPNASLHTPYGMTEALPVTDVDLATIHAVAGTDPVGGVCVGTPVSGAAVRVLPLDFDALHPPDDVAVGVTGEVLVRAPWVSDGYLGLWATERRARPVLDDGVWHRSGDVGHLDESGRLWIEGRAVHVIHTSTGAVTPVPIERTVEQALGRSRVAAVGVGPVGVQQVVVVVESDADGLAPDDLAASVRGVVEVPVAAVLVLRAVPVDIRHNAKIDRSAVARWADDLLAGRRARTP